MDFYVILGVDRGASIREVKRAYTRLARRYHPDINPGDREAEAFYRRATEAYETLSDAERRQAYDVHGARRPRTEAASVEFHGFDFSTSAPGASATFSELFSEVLHDVGRETGDGAEKGSDLYADVALSFEEALSGTERRLTMMRLGVCEACDGTGTRRAPETACGGCRGVGRTQWRRGHMVFAKSCTQCGGTGRQRRRPCGSCGSTGTGSRTDAITVHFPPGVANGTRMRVPEQGNAGPRGGAPGDLYITASVEDHRLFVRQGNDLHLSVPVTVTEAVLGAEFDVPTPDGHLRFRIRAGTPSGEQFRIAGRGAPSPRTGLRGDLIVTIMLTLPRVEDERSKELLREFGEINAADVRRTLFVE